LESFTTLDGSRIRGLAGPAGAAARHQSLRGATGPPGGATGQRLHRESEEISYFPAGSGRMRLGDDESEITAGDCVVIPPGTPHKLWADEAGPLVLLCACSPPYSDADTELIEDAD